MTFSLENNKLCVSCLCAWEAMEAEGFTWNNKHLAELSETSPAVLLYPVFISAPQPAPIRPGDRDTSPSSGLPCGRVGLAC